jgi:hypothetical protein
MTTILLVLSGYRVLVLTIIGLIMWILAYALYAKRFIKQYMHKGRPHSWSVDLVTKRATSRGRPEIS